jgi:membrane-associated protease RseP (regulator of RpoE activity)
MGGAISVANLGDSQAASDLGILGSGHVEQGHGVPHQLKDLGVAAMTALIPVSVDTACKLVGTAYADVLFTLPPGSDDAAPPERPRLGVVLAPGDGAPRINQVAGNSVAEAAGLLAGDHVVRAAGLEMRNVEDLVDTVAVQAPGTWLPLSIRRDGQEIEVVAKFPPRPREN